MERDEIFELAVKLAEFLVNRGTVYLTWDGNLDDFTKSFDGRLQIHARDQYISLTLPANVLHLVAPHILTQVFAADRLVICWDIKKLFSYLRYHLPPHFSIEVEAKIIDLKSAEAFAGIRGKKPQTWGEALDRVRPLSSNKHLPAIRQRLHAPLATRVLPAIETTGLLDAEYRGVRYASYEIEGSVNGRLSCAKVSDRFFNPHSLGDEEKVKFRAGPDRKFVVFDYKSMEVSILHWLSQDTRLGELLNSAQDLYRSIYEVISGRHCKSKADREFAKDVFLPIIFGQQARSLAERHSISVNGAQALIDRIHAAFPVALKWVDQRTNEVRRTHTLIDHFGRTRQFNEKLWTVRNAAIQGPAAVVCLDKLVTLFDRKPRTAAIVASVHDAYIMTVDKSTADYDIDVMREILQEPSAFYPGLSLRVGLKSGESLSELSLDQE